MNKRKWGWYLSRSTSALFFGAFGASTAFNDYEGHWAVMTISLVSAACLVIKTSMERMSYIIGWHDGMRSAQDVLELITRGEKPPDMAPTVEPWLRPAVRNDQ